MLMTDQPDQKSQKELEEEVWSAISAFEQILQAMPQDRGALEVLCHAYAKIGDHTRAKEYAGRLADVLIEQGDKEATSKLIETVRGYADEDAGTQELVARMEALVDTGAEGGGEAAPEAGDTAPAAAEEGIQSRGFDIANELSFAWGLLEANELTQEEYSQVVQDLSEMGAGDATATVSVLHVLEARGSRKLDRVMGHVSRECDTPLITLSNFEFQSEAVMMLSPEFMIRRGVAIFEVMGGDALAVAMNPYDKQLREDVEALVSRRCHFYITLPSEFDAMVDRVTSALEDVGSAGA